MKTITAALVVVAALFVTTTHPAASGLIGIYGIVERVVFEPSAGTPQRIQVWGAFAYVDTSAERAVRVPTARPPEPAVSTAVRGYLYFTVPDVASGVYTQADADLVRREWRDLATVAGTGEAVAFGRWGLIGNFSSLRPRDRADGLPYLFERALAGGTFADLRVRPASEAPASPATYQTNAGVVRLSAQGSHAAIVERLKAQLKP